MILMPSYFGGFSIFYGVSFFLQAGRSAMPRGLDLPEIIISRRTACFSVSRRAPIRSNQASTSSMKVAGCPKLFNTELISDHKVRGFSATSMVGVAETSPWRDYSSSTRVSCADHRTCTWGAGKVPSGVLSSSTWVFVAARSGVCGGAGGTMATA